MRYTSIDAFRGFAVAGMIFLNILNLFQGVPEWLMHAKGNGLTLADLVAPFFLFIVGVCLWISVSKRKKTGAKQSEIARHVFKRASILLIAGLFLDALVSIAFNPGHKLVIAPVWGVLEAIALAYLIAFFFIGFNWRKRVLVSFSLLAVYSVLLFLPEFANLVRVLPHGSLPGVVSWSFIVLIGTVFGELLLEKKTDIEFVWKMIKTGFALLFFGLLLNFIIPVNKTLVSSSYSITATAFSIILFTVFYYFFEMKQIKSRILSPLGINAIFAFFFHYAFVVLINYYSIWGFFKGMSAILLTLLLLAVSWLVVFALNRKDLIFHI